MTVYLCDKPLTFGNRTQIECIRFLAEDKESEEEVDAREEVPPDFFSRMTTICGRPPTFGDLEQIRELERWDELYRVTPDARINDEFD